MAATPRWRRYLRFWGPDPCADVDIEIAFHLEELARHYVALGLSSAEAQAKALRRFGNVAKIRSECLVVDRRFMRSTQRRAVLDALRHDVRDAARGLTRSPGFTAGAALILALGIGVTTVVYSFNKAVFFPTVPIEDSHRVVRFFAQNMARGVFFTALSEGEVADLTAATDSFEGRVAAYAIQSVTVSGDAEPERVTAMRATTNLFSVLKATPALGRAFSPEEAGSGSSVVVLSHRSWQKRWAGDPTAVGRAIRLNGRPHTIIGVMPERFWFESREIEAWLPLQAPRAQGEREARTLMAIGR